MMTTSRRLLAVAAAAVALAPVLSSCGFDYATDRPNTIANGGYHILGDVHVLAARIVAPEDGTGSFIATITTDADTPAVELTGLSGDDLTVDDLTPVEVPSHGMVNLATEGPIPVTGGFKVGDSVPVSLTFDTGDSIDVDAIVVLACHEYAGIAEEDAPDCDYPELPTVGGDEH
ncbi:hypothetical protein [Nocardioides sp.]|uniref:hypothetical protein n=1 Tax=Nocardioides sp. TaxID=35761 RepID=UPI0039E345BC